MIEALNPGKLRPAKGFLAAVLTLLFASHACPQVAAPQAAGWTPEQLQRLAEADARYRNLMLRLRHALDEETPFLDDTTPSLLGSSDGIFVGQPKIYDNRTLELMLQDAQNQLAQLQLLDKGKVLAQVGAVQGQTLSQSAFSAQISGPPVPQLITNTDTATAADKSVTTDNKSQSTTGGFSPQVPSGTPPTPLAFQGAPGLSALDTLNEEMQLTYEITNLRLILEASLNDQFVPYDGGPTTIGVKARKRSTVIGFPISIQVPDDGDHENAVAEVIVTVATGPYFLGPGFVPSRDQPLTQDSISGLLSQGDQLRGLLAKAHKCVEENVAACGEASPEILEQSEQVLSQRLAEFEARFRNIQPCAVYNGSSGSQGCPDAPGIMSILPRERTYNVATITDKSVSFGAAAVLKVINAGFSFFHGTKNYFLVQDQDTVAMTLRPSLPRSLARYRGVSTTFGWQFRPVLGQKAVRAGLRQTFAQLSFPVPEDAAIYGFVRVEAHWHRYDRKTNAVGDVIASDSYDGSTSATPWIGAWSLHQFDLHPPTPAVSWDEAGTGNLVVTAQNEFLRGTGVVIGSTHLDETTAAFKFTPEGLRFVAPANQLVAARNVYLENQSGQQRPLQSANGPEPANRLRIANVSVAAATATDAELTVCYSGGVDGTDKGIQPLVLIGDQVFGLSDKPITRTGAVAPCASKSLRFKAPIALILKTPHLSVKQLFKGPFATDESDIPLTPDLVPSALVPIDSANKYSTFLVRGAGIKGWTATNQIWIGGLQADPAPASLPVIDDKDCTKNKAFFDANRFSDKGLVLIIPDCKVKEAKQIVVKGNTDDIILLSLTKPDTPSPKVDSVHIKLGQAKAQITGTLLEQIDLSKISYNNTSVGKAELSPDLKQITFTVPDAIRNTVGIYALTVGLKDSKQPPLGCLVFVEKPSDDK